jgi:inorganic pyrophosphatase
MAKKSKQEMGLANPESLTSFDKDKSLVVVIIETPKGSRNKYAFDPQERIFVLKKVLPAGMAFPYDLDSCHRLSVVTVIPSTCWC